MTTFRLDPIQPTAAGASILRRWADSVRSEAWPVRSAIVDWIEANGWSPDDHDIVAELKPELRTHERTTRLLWDVACHEQVAKTAKSEGDEQGVAKIRDKLASMLDTIAARAEDSIDAHR